MSSRAGSAARAKGETSALELDDYPQSSGLDSRERLDSLDELKSPTDDVGGRNDDQGSEDELLLDPNLPEDEGGRRSHTEDGYTATEMAGGKPEEEDSPYPEVRAAVRNFDEDVPCNTLRAWTIGMLLVVLGASMNTLFSLRAPSISIGPLIAQIISWPMGHGWARFVPNKSLNFFGKRIPLNPGPFNIKEHSIIVVMAGVSFSVAYATDIILAQLVFYKQNFGITFQLLLTISTQSLGYGIAGMMRRFLGRYHFIPVDSSLTTSQFTRPP